MGNGGSCHARHKILLCLLVHITHGFQFIAIYVVLYLETIPVSILEKPHRWMKYIAVQMGPFLLLAWKLEKYD